MVEKGTNLNTRLERKENTQNQNPVTGRGNNQATSKKKSFGDRVKDNPAVLGGLFAGLVLFLVHTGLSEEQAVSLLENLLDLLIMLGVGGSIGTAIRGAVTPLSKK